MRKSFLLTAVICISSAVGTTNAQSLSSQSGFGSAIDMSGSELVVGEPLNHRFPGMVYVFEHGDSGWHLTQSLKASDGFPGNGFGVSVVLSDQLLIVGENDADSSAVGVYVFTKDGKGKWTQLDVIRPDSVQDGDVFGNDISYGKGHLFVTYEPAGGTPEVRVYDQDHDSGLWRVTATVEPEGEGNHDSFGTALATDGTTLYVGSPHDASGVVDVYTSDNMGGWAHAKKLTGGGSAIPFHAHAGFNTPEIGEAFGSKIRLVGDQLFVTAPGAERATGRVYSFRRSADGTFERGPNFTPFDARYGEAFARDVVFTGDEVWVSAMTLNQMSGGIYAMKFGDGGNEVVSARKMIEPAALSHGFYGEAMVGNEQFVAVGAAHDVFGSGAVYVYRRDSANGAWSSGEKLMSPDLNGYKSVTGGRVDCKDSSADGFGCDHVDLVSFLTDNDLGLQRGMRVSDLWGWTDSKTGHEYALVGRNDGTTFVDVTDAENPVNLGFLPRTAGSPPSIWRDIKVYKDHAYIVADGAGHHGMQIFDLHDLRNVANPPVVFHEAAHYDRIFSAHNIVIDEASGFAYTVGNSAGGETCGGGLHMIDIHDPVHPKFAGCFAHEGTGRAGTGYTHDAQCVIYKGPDERYTGHEICFGSNETALSIADVTDKKHPVAISRGDYPNPGYTHQAWLGEKQRYLYMDDELDEINGTTDGTRTLIWDVAQLDDPVLINEYISTDKSTDHNLYIRGHYMYQSNYVSGLRVVDISNPKAPVQVGYFDTVPWGPDKPGFNGSWSNYPFFKSGVIIVTSGEEGLFVLKRSEPHS